VTGPEAERPSTPPPMGRRLPRSFFSRDVLTVAPDLIGAVLVAGTGQERVAVRLTEVEAYHGRLDPASHAFRGRTTRNAVMFGPAGFLYVYFVYGMHWCANIVVGVEGEPSAVLLRAGEVIRGFDVARERRTRAGSRPPRDHDLARGPAVLAGLLGLTGADSGADLIGPKPPFTVHRGGGTPIAVDAGPRVGVAAGGDVPWRYFDPTSRTVSAYRPGGRTRRGVRG
jgi:DNA-3-methyladenine glycosylase